VSVGSLRDGLPKTVFPNIKSDPKHMQAYLSTFSHIAKHADVQKLDLRQFDRYLG